MEAECPLMWMSHGIAYTLGPKAMHVSAGMQVQ